MKKTLKKALVLVLALAMVLGLATTAFASDNLGEQPAEEVVEQTEDDATEEEAIVETEGKYAGISSRIMEVIEGLEDGPDYVEGELLVIYEDVESAENATKMMCANGEEAVQTCGDETVKVTFDENEISMEDKIIELAKEENVKYVQPNYIYYLIDGVDYYEAYEEMAEMMTIRMDDEVNDRYANNQFYLSQVHMAEAWKIVEKYGTSKVKVAVIDTGAKTNHEDLTNLNKNLCVCVEGDTTPYPKQTTDDQGHGTHVSGIIGATANNGKGIAGGATLGNTDVSSRLELFTIDAFTRFYIYGQGYVWGANSDDLKKALVFATDNGAKVINMSLGSTEETAEWQDDAMKEGIDYAYDHGAVCVCAAGNEYTNSNTQSTYPSDYDKVISVIALDTIWVEDGYIGEYYNEYIARALFSNFGDAQDIAAPGVNIASTYYNSTSSYTYLDGTSQATPIVSSVIALMFMMNPNLKFNDVYSIITSTADDLVYEMPSMQYDVNSEKYVEYTEVATEGFDIYTAYGMINAEACVLALAPEVFSDVHKTDWFYSSVSNMYYRNIMTGIGGGSTFAPGDTLLRCQLAKILYYMEDQPSVTYTAKFPDVPQDAWFANPVIWAYENNIITGYGSGLFGPGDVVTREQFATMLYRYAKYKFPNDYDHYGYADISGYQDSSAVSDWAEEAVKWAVGAGIITGKDSGTKLDPHGNTTRCECAAMIERFMTTFQF